MRTNRGIGRRGALGVLAAAGAGSLAMIAQVSSPPARSADQELQIARQNRMSDAQLISMVKLPPDIEPAFRFRP